MFSLNTRRAASFKAVSAFFFANQSFESNDPILKSAKTRATERCFLKNFPRIATISMKSLDDKAKANVYVYSWSKNQEFSRSSQRG
jgi:hypothetical protein